MTSDTDLERTRRFSLAEVKRLLAMVDPNADKLFAKARTVLGAERAARCLELARLAPLTGRWVPTSAVAQLVVGTMDVGADWWARPHEELDASRVWAQTGTPDALLESGHGDAETEDGDSCLALLGRWIADDAADKEWGRPVDRVDMSDPRVDGRIVLPDGAKAGDRLTAIFAPGGRVWRTASTPVVARRTISPLGILRGGSISSCSFTCCTRSPIKAGSCRRFSPR